MDRPSSRSIQLRLTAWYTTMLAVTFILIGIGLWMALNHSIDETADRELHSRLANVRHYFDSFTPSDLQHLEEEFREESLLSQASATIRIADQQGRWLFQTPGTEKWPAQKIDLATLPAKGRTITVRVRHQLIRVLTAPVRVGAVQIGLPIDEFEDVKNGFFWIIGLGSPLLLVLAWLGGFWMSGETLKPIEDAFRRMTRFTADASHELRTPTAIIQTTADLMQTRPRTAEEHAKAWQTVAAATQRASMMIADLLTLARADDNHSMLTLVPTNLDTMVTSAVQQMEVSAVAKGLTLQITSLAQLKINVDPDALQRAICILIDNAIKFTPSPGDVLVMLQANPRPTITVSDTGSGIEPEHIPHIFDRFYRVSTDRSRKLAGGAGLGLSIANQIVRQHGGEIQVTSAPNQGSKFSILLPLKSL